MSKITVVLLYDYADEWFGDKTPCDIVSLTIAGKKAESFVIGFLAFEKAMDLYGCHPNPNKRYTDAQIAQKYLSATGFSINKTSSKKHDGRTIVTEMYTNEKFEENSCIFGGRIPPLPIKIINK